MRDTHFILTLKRTVKKLKEKNTQLLQELKQSDQLAEKDPEKSRLHDMWHTYRLQTEFKEFAEGLLSERINTSKAS